jgi:hypothetical protein
MQVNHKVLTLTTLTFNNRNIFGPVIFHAMQQKSVCVVLFCHLIAMTVLSLFMCLPWYKALDYI